MIDREAIAQQEADIDRDAAAEYWGNDNPPLELIAVCRRVRQAAYAAGMERAAEIAESVVVGKPAHIREDHRKPKSPSLSRIAIAAAIRAEKDKS